MAGNEKIELIQAAILGESSDKIHLNSREECRATALRLASQARRNILIFSHDLEPQIYDRKDFLEAVKTLAIGNRECCVKILLQDNEKVQREGHRMIQLWRRLTSKIEIRIPHPDFIEHPESFMIVDDTGYLHHRFYTGFEASADFNARLEAGKLSGFFQEVWDQSEPDSELRDLHI